MSDDLHTVSDVEQKLAATAGGYLRNPIRRQYATCSTCTTPVDPERRFEHCYPCNQLRGTTGIADLVVPLTYCIEGEQSHWMIRHYKDDPDAETRHRLTVVMSRLLFLGIMLHEPCIEARVGQTVDLRLAVPSLSGRLGAHPFTELTDRMNATGTPRLIAAAGVTSARVFSAGQYFLEPDTDLSGQHILVLDDTWTTGSRTQSAALALRRHGAKYVSVMVVGRYVRPTFAKNAEFIRTNLRSDYNPRLCPVSGGDCVEDDGSGLW